MRNSEHTINDIGYSIKCLCMMKEGYGGSVLEAGEFMCQISVQPLEHIFIMKNIHTVEQPLTHSIKINCSIQFVSYFIKYLLAYMSCRNWQWTIDYLFGVILEIFMAQDIIM